VGKMMGYCGVDCGACIPFRAKEEDNDELRRCYAREQSEVFGITITPEQVNCDGCLSEGEHLGYCSVCEIRRCCRERNLEDCSFCEEYVCEELKKVYEVMCEVFGKGTGGVAHAQVTLDTMKQNRLTGKR